MDSETMQNFRAWLQLVRLPAVFTAMADIFLGFLLVRGSFGPAGAFAALLGASSCLYLAGMLFNDVFDRTEDARLRPERPLPSGRVPLAGAIGFGALLVAVGLGSAATVGAYSLFTAGALAIFIFAYDGGAKRTAWGPAVMGACRFLNVLLGASLAIPFPPLAALLGIGLGVYVAGLTWFARQEAERSRRGHLLGAAAVVNAGIGILIWVVLEGDEFQGRFQAAILLAMIATSIDFRLLVAIRRLDPRTVQAAVRTMLLSLVMLDAALVYFVTDGNALYAMLTAALVVPSLVIGRFMAMT